VLYVGEEEYEGERKSRAMVKGEYIIKKKKDEPEKEDGVLMKNKERN